MSKLHQEDVAKLTKKIKFGASQGNKKKNNLHKAKDQQLIYVF